MRSILMILLLSLNVLAEELPLSMTSTINWDLKNCAEGCPFEAKKELAKELYDNLQNLAPSKKDKIHTVYAYQREYGKIVSKHIDLHLDSDNLLGAIEAASFVGNNDCGFLGIGNARGIPKSSMARLEKLVESKGLEAFEQENFKTSITLALWNIRDNDSPAATKWVEKCLETSPENKQCLEVETLLKNAKQAYKDLWERGGISMKDLVNVKEDHLCSGEYNPLSDVTYYAF